MRRIVLPLAAVILIGWLAVDATAQATKTARGTVTAIAGEVLTIKAGDQEMKFTVDGKTIVTAEGGSTATREAEAAGKQRPTLSSLVKVGNAVEVTYMESGGAMRATRVRRVIDVSTSGAKPEEARETANGTIESMAGTTVTIVGSSGGGATFKQSFTVDNTTQVVGEGAGTAANARGGKLVLADYLSVGDAVTITYHKVGDTLHAARIRVTKKAVKK